MMSTECIFYEPIKLLYNLWRIATTFMISVIFRQSKFCLVQDIHTESIPTKFMLVLQKTKIFNDRIIYS